MVVKLTQEQADYLETFNDKSRAFYYISSWGWGSFLKNGLEEVYKTKEEVPFTIDEKEKMLNALINGYEVDVPKFKFYNFSNETGTIPLYYTGKDWELTAKSNEAEHIEKNSKEYIALEILGFYKEKV